MAEGVTSDSAQCHYASRQCTVHSLSRQAHVMCDRIFFHDTGAQCWRRSYTSGEGTAQNRKICILRTSKAANRYVLAGCAEGYMVELPSMQRCCLSRPYSHSFKHMLKTTCCGMRHARSQKQQLSNVVYEPEVRRSDTAQWVETLPVNVRLCLS